MTLVVDASVMVSALVGGEDGEWALSALTEERLAAPHLMIVEVANILRRSELAGSISSDEASLAHAELGSLTFSYFAYSPFSERIWELRKNLTAYDAWYVALAEALEAPLATLDLRLSRAPGPNCEFHTPD